MSACWINFRNTRTGIHADIPNCPKQEILPPTTMEIMSARVSFSGKLRSFINHFPCFYPSNTSIYTYQHKMVTIWSKMIKILETARNFKILILPTLQATVTDSFCFSIEKWTHYLSLSHVPSSFHLLRQESAKFLRLSPTLPPTCLSLPRSQD